MHSKVSSDLIQVKNPNYSAIVQWILKIQKEFLLPEWNLVKNLTYEN